MTPKELVAEFISRCNAACRGDAADPYALLTEDVHVSVPGKTILSGEYPNKEIIQNVFVAAVAERMGEMHFDLSQVIGQGDRVATMVVTTGESVDGERYNPKGEVGGYVFGVRGDLIEEIVVFPDNTMVETVILGRRYLPPSEGTNHG